MPYENERASGDSLIWLENSQALKEFEGAILVKEGECTCKTADAPGTSAQLVSKASNCY